MESRFLKNPFPDFVSAASTPISLSEEHVKELICTYVDSILDCSSSKCEEEDDRGSLYVGSGGIAYMFWKLARSEHFRHLYPALKHAETFMRDAKTKAERHQKRPFEPHAFLAGTAGVYAVSAAISHDLKRSEELASDLANFKAGIASSKKKKKSSSLHTEDSSLDDVLTGRAGFLAGCYWLNDVLNEEHIAPDDIISICQLIIKSGREYARETNAPLPLMYQLQGEEFLGASRGLCSILHMLLDSPWFRDGPASAPSDELRDIQLSVEFFLTLQNDEGNFPPLMKDCKSGGGKRLVQWCHGASGVVYLLAKAYLVFKEPQYLMALRRVADLVWLKGFLRKGPGICHGVAGSGYVFLLLHRLTNEPKYMYRAVKFMELLTNDEFKQETLTIARPHTLYEGVAGTVCFLIDLMQPQRASFPFMDVFH